MLLPDIPLIRAGYELKPLDLATRFDEIADRATGEVVGRLRNSNEARKVTMPHLLRAAELSVDKSQLLRGQPTSVNAVVERQELVVILQAAIKAGLEEGFITSGPTQNDIADLETGSN